MGCKFDDSSITEVDPDARDTDPMESIFIPEMLISGDDVVNSGQSVFEAGALRLPSADLGLVITKMGDNVGEARPSAESKEPSTTPPAEAAHQDDGRIHRLVRRRKSFGHATGAASPGWVRQFGFALFGVES